MSDTLSDNVEWIIESENLAAKHRDDGFRPIVNDHTVGVVGSLRKLQGHADYLMEIVDRGDGSAPVGDVCPEITEIALSMYESISAIMDKLGLPPTDYRKRIPG